MEYIKKFILQRWIVNISIAASLTILGLASYYRNRFDVYSVWRLENTYFVILPVFLITSFFSNVYIFPLWKKFSRRGLVKIFLIAAPILGLFLWLLPIPVPDVMQQHQMVIRATGDKGTSAHDSLVEIRELRTLDNRIVPLESILMTPDWQSYGNVLISRGAPDSRLEIQGNMPFGLMVNLRYFNDGGKAQLIWDGAAQEIDLFNPQSTTVTSVFKGLNLFSMDFDQAVLVILLSLLYGCGIYWLILVFLTFLQNTMGKKFTVGVYWLLFIGLLITFFAFKFETLGHDAARTFRDTTSYVTTAEMPLMSAAFWAGTRPFTYPLLLKLLGTTTQNFQTMDQMGIIARFQLIFSAISWGILALALASSTRLRWLGAIVSGMVMFFGLSLEICLWDSLLLSESISFSLLALMMASWIWFFKVLSMEHSAWLHWGLFGLTTITTFLYSFVRDGNIYFVLVGALIFLLGWLVTRKTFRYRKVAWSCLGMVAALFLLQNISMSFGNRWQIFMYDQLAMRFLQSREATQYFVGEGLPLNDKLLQTTQMVGYQYQELFAKDPAMEPVRAWIDCCSKTAYLKYLLSHPGQTLLEPIQNTPKLINVRNLEYRSPLYGIQPAPALFVEADNLFFNHQPWVLIVLGLAGLVWFVVFWQNQVSPGWIVIFVLLISLYPMMFFIWYAEPMEIERHAAQIGLQFRLGGWLCLLLITGKVVGNLLARFLPKESLT